MSEDGGYNREPVGGVWIVRLGENNMCRPKNWEEYLDGIDATLLCYEKSRELVEAGADAMLKAIKEDMENLLAYASNNDQCSDEEYDEISGIGKRWGLSR